MINDITLQILNYNRPGNLVKICERFKDFMPMEIINNNPAYRIPKNFYDAKIINNSSNKYSIERWYHAIQCETPFICLLDDDILPFKKTFLDFQKNLFLHPNSITGIFGIKNNSSFWCENTEVDLVLGSCSLVRVSCIRKIFKKYIIPLGKIPAGDDVMVSLAINKIFKNKHYIVNTEVELLPGATDGLHNREINSYLQQWKNINNSN